MRKYNDKKRQVPFVNTVHINQVLIPTYNALRDPFLIGFFNAPTIRRHLKITGVLKKKRKLTPKFTEEFPYNQVNFPLSGRPKTERVNRKSRSLSKSAKNQELRLPQLQLQSQQKVQQRTKQQRKVSTGRKGRDRSIHL